MRIRFADAPTTAIGGPCVDPSAAMAQTNGVPCTQKTCLPSLTSLAGVSGLAGNDTDAERFVGVAGPATGTLQIAGVESDQYTWLVSTPRPCTSTPLASVTLPGQEELVQVATSAAVAIDTSCTSGASASTGGYGDVPL